MMMEYLSYRKKNMDEVKNLYSKLHNLYPISKTLRFELIPIGKTKENMEKNNIITEDEHRNKKYKIVKKYCDEYHKTFIDNKLSDLKLQDLQKYYDLFNIANKTDEQRKYFTEIQKQLRKKIVEKFMEEKKEFEGLFGKDLISIYLGDFYEKDKEKIQDIDEFKRFTTYFKGFNKNRENMYSDEEKSTAIAYRLINENLPTFITNMRIYNNVIIKNPDIVNKVYNELNEYIQTYTLDEMFKLEYFNDVLTQKGIEIYNIIISGKTENNNNKIKGLNEYINEYNQSHKEKIPKLKELYKQILSDKIGTSFVIDSIENDSELINYINEYYKEFTNLFEENNDDNIIKLISNLDQFNINKIYVNNDISLTTISQKIYGDWNYINSCIYEDYDNTYIGRAKIGTDQYLEKKKQYFKSTKCFSLQYLKECVSKDEDSNGNKLLKYFEEFFINKDDDGKNLIDKVIINYNNCTPYFNTPDNENLRELMKNSNAITKIKELLDSMKDIQSFIKLLIPKDSTIEKDEIFYGAIENDYKVLIEIIPLYNKTRNYLTQKPYSTEKIKLNFKNPNLLEGWDINKEQEDYGMIFIKDGQYFLGILNANIKDKNIFNEENTTKEQVDVYKKIEYKLLPTPNKMLPKVFFSKSRIDEFNPSNELINKYKLGKYKKGDNFDIDFCRELIDFYKESIKKNKDWKYFNFKFKDTKDYNDISEFYREVEQQGYYINFQNISDRYMNQLVNNGNIYLFQIYNKDFSQYSHGKENLHTMYWKALFNEDNLKNVVYKLNGQAEVFYRKASLQLKDTTIHVANNPINNKNEITRETKPTSIFDYNLIKNKRYTMDKFQFHVPITINFNSMKINNINEIVNKYLKYNEDIHVIGIDRGERNLLYISIIDKNENVVYQSSMNEIVNEYKGKNYKTNYHDLLNQKEEEREKARESWQSVENIKELKEGYMSQVIHKLTNLMVKYNAIIVIEDLNSGFKNSRKKVEKQVYQKFEQMLINKLNYLVFKDKDFKEDGGILNAYQLTNKFESFNKIGKQTGTLFYIPAWFTSKIDPTTGFVSLFYIKNEGVEKSQEFVNKIEDIRYNNIDNYFEFDIDYEKFTDRLNESKRFWTICSYGKRINTFRNPNKNNQYDSCEVNITEEIKELFNKYNIDLKNIKKEILSINDTKFFNAKKETDGFYGFTNLFRLMTQMRNSESGTDKDILISPVKNQNNKFFDSSEGNNNLPIDADANGAYNIARKGLMLINQIKNTEDDKLGKIKYNITQKEWLAFAQKGKEK